MNKNAKLQQWYRKQIESMKGIDPVDRFEFINYLTNEYVMIADIDAEERVSVALDMFNKGFDFGKIIEHDGGEVYLLEYNSVYINVLAKSEKSLKEAIMEAIGDMMLDNEPPLIDQMRALLTEIAKTSTSTKLLTRINKLLAR